MPCSYQLRALRLVGTQNEVYVRRGTQTLTVPVQIGLTSDTMSQIVSGNVKEGDQVLSNPATALTAAANNRAGGFRLFGLFGGGARVPAGGGNFGGGGGNFGGGARQPAGGAGGNGGGNGKGG